VAQKIQTLFTDDLDGSEAQGTVRFAGRHRVRDRPERRARPGAAGCAGTLCAGGAAGRRRHPAGGPDSTDVREWAKAQGIEVKDRGRVPAEVAARFTAATRQQGPGPVDTGRRGNEGYSGRPVEVKTNYR